MESKLVITVAAQNDICPHGNTYPIKAVIIDNNKIKTPENHTNKNFHEELIKFLIIWINIKKKNIEAPLMWINRTNQPKFTSREIWTILKKENSIIDL